MKRGALPRTEFGLPNAESAESTQFIITTRTAPVLGDHATLHLTGATGTRSVRVRVVESQLHVVKDVVRHRVRLTCVDETPMPLDLDKGVSR